MSETLEMYTVDVSSTLKKLWIKNWHERRVSLTTNVFLTLPLF